MVSEESLDIRHYIQPAVSTLVVLLSPLSRQMWVRYSLSAALSIVFRVKQRLRVDKTKDI